jgi:hypothetical protein
MIKYAFSIALCIGVSMLFGASCVTPKPAQKPTNEDDIVKAGAGFFIEGKITQAEATWSEIPDPAKRSLYITFAEAYSAFDAAVARAEKNMTEKGPEAAITAAKDSGEPPTAPEPALAADPLDARARLARVGEEAVSVLAARASEAERAADAQLDSARSYKARESADSAGKAAEGFAAAGKLFRDASAWKPEAASGALRAEAKARSAEELRKTLLKEFLLSFPERMGEIFARAPASSDKLDDRNALDFNAETAAMISGSLSDFDAIVSEYPDILDPATLDRLRNSARGLSTRFAQIEAVIESVKDRGKPVMPMIIGIFNPEPDDPQRSRPATFSGDSASGPEWWWGIVDIPRGLAQDLVITMNDARPIRVYAAGLGLRGKRPASDLVNPLFRVGNSWPVLNAGARLDNGVFHIEVGPGSPGNYSGEAVVYKSFMMRTR